MNALMIKDLSVTEELDSKKMSAVRGGFVPFPSNHFVNIMPISLDASKTVYAKQSNATEIGMQLANGSGSAFQTDVTQKSNPYVDNDNSIKL